MAQIASSGTTVCGQRPRLSYLPVSSSLESLFKGRKFRNKDIDEWIDDQIARRVCFTLAKSWLSPPKMQVKGDDYHNDGYDPTQRAYVLTRVKSDDPVALRLTLDGSEASPVLDPAIVIKDWGEGGAQLKIDGKSVAWGKAFRLGYIRRLESTDLVIWIQKQSTIAIQY